MNDCHYLWVGYALELLAHSDYHRRLDAVRYVRTEILPPLELGQCRFYLGENDSPVAMATWAWLDAHVEAEVHSSGRALDVEEWNVGERLFFNDWIAPYGGVRQIVTDMTTNVFPEHVATSLRRRSDGSVRKVDRWTGVDVRSRHAVEKAS